MPKLAPPSFNGVNLPPDLRRVLEAAMRPAAAALNKALVVGDSLQVWGPLLVTGTGAGTVGVTGSGTAGSIPKWSGSSALADSGASMDGNNRLAVPVGIAFPGGSTLDAAPVTISGSGVANQVAYWSSSTGITGHSGFTYDGAGNVTATGKVTGAKFQVTDAANPHILDAAGIKRVELLSDGSTRHYGNRNGANHYFDALTVISSNQVYFIVNYQGSTRFTVSRDGDGAFTGALTVTAASTLTGKISQGFTDSSGSPGAATINKPTGRSAIAAGASSVVITNSLVTAASQVKITKRQFDATLTDHIEVCATGSFTVTGNAAATAAWAFDWQVLN